jgi:rhodanese-related sulfurtransferase
MYKRIMTLAATLLVFAAATGFAAIASNIGPEDAAAMIRQRPDVYLLDVRTPQEYRQAHLTDAHLIPIDQVERRVAEIPLNRPIVVYCAVGSRSAQVFGFLARRGYAEVYNLDGGIVGWMQRGYPVIR